MSHRGDVAQLAEHLLCKQGVVGSIPIVSTITGTGIISSGITGTGMSGSGTTGTGSEVGCECESDRGRMADVE